VPRIVRIAARTVLGIGLVAACIVGAALWRIRRGPVPLDFLVSRVEAEFGAEDPASAVHLDGIDLVWDGVDRHVELRARGFRVGDATAGPAVVDAVRLKLRARSLLRGKAYVQGIEVDGLHLQLVRHVDDRLTLQGRTMAGETRDLSNVWMLVRRLETVVVQAGRIDYLDERTGTRWVIPRLDGRIWRDGEQVRAEIELAVVSNETTIPVAVGAVYSPATGTVEVRGGSSGTDLAAAFAAWPATLAPEAHAWVTGNVRDGRITDARLELTVRRLPGEGGKLAVDAFRASVAFTGLTVRFVDTMPAVTGVAGEARFGPEDVIVDVSSGRLDEVAVGPAKVHVTWPRESANQIAIEAAVEGPLAGVIAVLDHDPVNVGAMLGLPVRGVEGRVAGRLRLAFPLEGRPRAGQLGLRASATITGASLPQVAGDWDLAGGELSLQVSDRTMTLDGTAAIRGTPVRLRYRERIATPPRRRLLVDGRLEPPNWQGLGLETGGWLAGPVEATVRIAPDEEGRTTADVDLDLGASVVELPALRLAKASGTPGRAALRLGVARGVVTAVERAVAVLPGVTVRGTAARPPAGGSWSRVDATVWLSSIDPSADPLADPGPTEVVLQADDQGWRTTIASRDVGRLLRFYGWETVSGGRMTFDGVADLSAEGLPFDGELVVEDVTLSRMPWLVNVVSLASVRGLLDVGRPQSVMLDRVVARVGHRPPLVTVADGVARGPKLSLMLAGTLDLGSDALALEGTLVPSYYLLNQGATSIPVLGAMIERATGGAVQAVAFTVGGTRTEPVVSVQPLSSLAPGVLREWLRKLGL
jgi:hypothetical protein